MILVFYENNFEFVQVLIINFFRSTKGLWITYVRVCLNFLIVMIVM